MKTVTTSQAIQILTKGLGLESLAHSTFSNYCKLELVSGKVSPTRNKRESFMWLESDILKSINKIKDYKNQKVIDLARKNKNKTKISRDSVKDEEPANYAKAFLLFNK